MRAVVVTVAVLSCLCSSLAFAPAASARSVVHMMSRHHVAHRAAATQPLAARRSSSEDEALAGMRLDESKLDEAEQKRLAGVSSHTSRYNNL
eukprot:2992-Heterococcus_DN1.PRE.5